VSRLIGAPPGYVGYEEAGQLTEAVRRRPYAVVLFDEIEKAHAEVLNVMLQLLDDGRLTDGKGRTVDFKNTVVIMTSNLGSQFIAERATRGSLEPAPSAKAGGASERGWGPASPETAAELDEHVRRQVTEALRQHFRPEFLNRVDEIIFFHALSRQHIKAIIDIQLRHLLKRLADRKIHVEMTEAAKDLIVEEGFDPAYGARPLKRTIQRRVLDPLAMRMLQGEFGEGDRIVVDAAQGEVRFTRQQPVTA
jgi:ATP-dependent Clp protease ATP-binding subunit ClpB